MLIFAEKGCLNLYLMTQYNLKSSLRTFREKKGTAAIDELTQLYSMDTWTVMVMIHLLQKVRIKFLKEKRTGNIEEQACTNGVSQQAYIPKEDAALSTVLTKLTFITSAIAIGNRRKVRCYNIPSPCLNMDVDKRQECAHVGESEKRVGRDHGTNTPQVYVKYLTVDRKGMPILYVKLQKALYGLMRASLLFYRKLWEELEEYELK
jgi:hypothetical protein